jgi:pimeloyl-ACP methyl ester carboxylesterase
LTTKTDHTLSQFLRTSVLMAAATLAACSSSANPPIHEDEVDDEVDRTVEVFEAGSGDATVVFESGFGNDWTPWQTVANEVAMDARVFAYSRPGYGQSEPSDEPRDATHIVEELRTLLTAHEYAPPYILVGHSFGGAYMELFAKTHPDEVAGLVLVDPRHRDFTATCEDSGYTGCTIPPSLVAALPRVQMDELAGFAEISDEISAAGSFGTYPVRVLTATSHGFAPEVEALWVAMLGSLAAEAAHGEQQIFTGAGHSLELERPRDVAAAVLEMVSAAYP